jgi:ferredoxin-NADP reductase
MIVTFDHAEVTAGSISTFYFKPPSKLNYTAGQFIEMFLPHDNPDDRGIKRWFTLSSSPTQELLSITTRHAEGQVSTFKQQLFALKPGDEVRMIEPMGDFVLPIDPEIPLVFVAGGIGITPYHSMIQWLHDSGKKRNIKLLYAVRNKAEACFLPLLKDIDLTLRADDQADHPFRTEDILAFAQGQEEALIYLAGPEPMVEMFYKELKAVGIRNDRLVTDYFPNYTGL